MKKILTAIIILFVLQSCSTGLKFQVSRIGNEPEEYNNRMIYVLPQTLFKVTVDFERVTNIPGPYRIYCERFLGIDDYISETSVSYRIKNINVESFTEPDPDQYYSINVMEGQADFQKYLHLTNQGFILDPGQLFGYDNVSYLENRKDQTGFFTETPVKTNLTEKTDTLFKTIITDSSYVKIPVVRKQVEAKTEQQKAQEAATLIVQIRQKKLRMLSGGKNLKPETDAFIFAIKELAEMERQNIELFTGKTVHNEFSKVFIVTPDANKQNQQIPIARFSVQSGLSEIDSNFGEEILVGISSLEKTREVSNSQTVLQHDLKPDNLYYRIPDICTVQVKIATDLLFESRQSVYQAGAFVNIPVRE